MLVKVLVIMKFLTEVNVLNLGGHSCFMVRTSRGCSVRHGAMGVQLLAVANSVYRQNELMPSVCPDA